MNIQEEIKIAERQLSEMKCPDCGKFHKVEITHRNEMLMHNLETIRCGSFIAWANKRMIILAQSINLEKNEIL